MITPPLFFFSLLIAAGSSAAFFLNFLLILLQKIPAKVPTAIENAEVATSGKGIYTALGQYVGEKDAWSALPAGVYIVDGVKMVK